MIFPIMLQTDLNLQRHVNKIVRSAEVVIKLFVEKVCLFCMRDLRLSRAEVLET